MFRRFFLFVLLMAGILFSGQKTVIPCQIKLKIAGIKDTTVYLASYFGDKILKIDSLRLNHEGRGILTREKAQKEGLYLFYLDEKNYFEFLIGNDQQFSIEADFNNSSRNKFSGAAETEAFRDYQVYLSNQKSKKTALETRLNAIPEKTDSVKILREKISDLNSSMENYWKEVSEKYKGTFFSDFLRSMLIPKVDDLVLPINAKNQDSFAGYTSITSSKIIFGIISISPGRNDPHSFVSGKIEQLF